MKRRTFATTAAGLALGVPATGHARTDPSDGDVDCSETVEVVTRRGGTDSNPTEPVETAEWPKPWREHVDHAEEVISEISSEYRNESWYVGSGMILSDERERCGKPEFVVRIHATDVAAARSEVEAERDGVGIVVEEGEPAFLQSESSDGGAPRLALLGGALSTLAGIGYVAVRRRSGE